jgi:hypothetical protein
MSAKKSKDTITFNAGALEPAAYYKDQLARVAQEHKAGRYFHPVYREETAVTNQRLNDLIYETLSANFRGWCYYKQSNHAEARKEFAKYHAAQNKIFNGDHFSDEEKRMAYTIFD